MNRIEKDSFRKIPQRYIEGINGAPSEYQDSFLPAFFTAFSFPRFRDQVTRASTSKDKHEIFVGNGTLIREHLGDLLVDIINAESEEDKERLLKSTFITIDLNEFRSFDAADKEMADRLSDEACSMVREQCDLDSEEYVSITFRVFGDEFYVLRIPKKNKNFAKMKEDHALFLQSTRQNIGRLAGNKRLDGQTIFSPLSGKAKGVFMCEVIPSQIPTSDAEKDPFLALIQEVMTRLGEIKDVEHGRRYDRTYTLSDSSCLKYFGRTDENSLNEKLVRAKEAVVQYESLRRPTLDDDRIRLEDWKIPLRPETCPLWYQEMTRLFEALGPLTIPVVKAFIDAVRERPIVDSFSYEAGFPILTHEAFIYCLAEEIRTLADDEDIAVIALNPAYTKEINATISWSETDKQLKTMLSPLGQMLMEAKSQKSAPFVLMKEATRFFVLLKTKKNKIREIVSRIQTYIDSACRQSEIPLTGLNGLLFDRPDITTSPYSEHIPDSTNLFAGVGTTYLSEVLKNSDLGGRKIQELTRSSHLNLSGTLLDTARNKATYEKYREYLIRAQDLANHPEIHLIFDRRSPRFPARRQIALDVIRQEGMAFSSDNPIYKRITGD